MRTVAHVGLAFVLVLIAACSGGAETTEVPTAAGAADDESAIVALPRSESDLALDTADLVLVGIGSLDQPVDAASRAGATAVYFVSRTGTIHRFIDGEFAEPPEFGTSDLTVSEGERRLLGLAFAATGNVAYVNYTNRAGETSVVAKGLRNPRRVDLFDDRLWLADVGQNDWEEVSVLDGVSRATTPVDFGWSAYETNERFDND